MRKILVGILVGSSLALAAPAAFASKDGSGDWAVRQPSLQATSASITSAASEVDQNSIIHGTVSLKWVDSQGARLIAVDGYPSAVQDEFWTQVRVGDTVERIGGRWAIVARGTPWNSGD